ncbi:hypothetical protein TNCV_3070471 [Trichonephila clavipes]|nr:hypothetical protein TNCV_3070471 [Trichonephila clavipes]
MPVVNRSFEHDTGDSKIWLVSTPILREDTWWWSGTSHFSTPSTNQTRGLAARRLFRVAPYRKGTIHLQTSMSSPGFEPSPYGTADIGFVLAVQTMVSFKLLDQLSFKLFSSASVLLRTTSHMINLNYN